MKDLVFPFSILALFLVLVWWAGDEPRANGTPHAFSVGLVLDKGGRDDQSFNESAYRGATQAKNDLHIGLKVVEASDDTAYEPSQRTFAQLGSDLTIGVGFAQAGAMARVAPDFPQRRFLIIDSDVPGPNIRSVMFKENEGSYLMGAIAALTTKTKAVGFVGGMDIPLIRRFELGYESGVHAIDPTLKVIVNYVGSTSDAWRNPTRGKELALSQYQSGADIIFTAAGASGLGVFDAAEEEQALAIGVDSNQDCLKPGRILTSMLKKVDKAVFTTISEAQQGRFVPGKFEMGLAQGGVDYTLDDCNRTILKPSVLTRVNELNEQIIHGKIQVPDYYEIRKGKKT